MHTFAICKHLINNPQILNGQNKLFGGSSQYDCINNILRKIVNDPQHIQVFQRLKLPAQYFGTHSIGKGAASFVACGITSCPPIASICILANWKMPGVINQYIKKEVAGDQYVGRAVSGRNWLGHEFAESSPYWDFSEFSLPEKV